MRSKAVPQMTLGGLALLGVTVSAAGAASSRPALPRYDPVQLCKVGLEGTPGQVLRELCIRPEREARADLRRRWSALPAEALSRCVEQQTSLRQTYGGTGSYRGLRFRWDQPIQSEGEIPPTEQRTKAPAPPERRRGTIAYPANPTNTPSTPGTGINPGTSFGTPGLGTPGTGTGGTGALGTTGPGLGSTGIGTPGLGGTGVGTSGTTGTGLGTPGLGIGGTGTTGIGSSGLGTSGGTGSSLGGGSTGGGAAGGAGSSGGSGGGGGR